MINLGSVGIGMVWGWLLTLAGERGQSLWRNAISAGVTTGTVTYGIYQLFGESWAPAIYFGGAAVLAVLLHSAFLQSLRLRYRS